MKLGMSPAKVTVCLLWLLCKHDTAISLSEQTAGSNNTQKSAGEPGSKKYFLFIPFLFCFFSYVPDVHNKTTCFFKNSNWGNVLCTDWNVRCLYHQVVGTYSSHCSTKIKIKNVLSFWKLSWKLKDN